MVKMGHAERAAIRSVRYSPPPGAVGDIEITSLARMRERGGPAEFRTPQRLEFDVLFRVDAGSAVHTVDFTEYRLAAGDVMWVRAGQMQQWGVIDDMEGSVLLFTSAAVDSETLEWIRASGVITPNHWPGTALERGAAGPALASVFATAAPPLSENGIRDAARARLLAATLLLLATAAPDDGDRYRPPTQQAFIWFRDELEANFRTRHKVTEYAARLGYSTRTLNRLARENLGLSAKELIDERIVLEAKRLLAHGRDPVARIADDLGFDDPSNFSKYFQQRTGLTPVAFRQRRAGITSRSNSSIPEVS